MASHYFRGHSVHWDPFFSQIDHLLMKFEPIFKFNQIVLGTGQPCYTISAQMALETHRCPFKYVYRLLSVWYEELDHFLPVGHGGLISLYR